MPLSPSSLSWYRCKNREGNGRSWKRYGLSSITLSVSSLPAQGNENGDERRIHISQSYERPMLTKGNHTFTLYMNDGWNQVKPMRSFHLFYTLILNKVYSYSILRSSYDWKKLTALRETTNKQPIRHNYYPYYCFCCLCLLALVFYHSLWQTHIITIIIKYSLEIINNTKAQKGEKGK